MNGQRKCAACEASLAPDAAEDLCPTCLLEAGVLAAESAGDDNDREDVTLPPDMARLEEPTLPTSQTQQPTPQM